MGSYSVNSTSYLHRARCRLDSGLPEDLFYAAFEIRCGVESRMQEYLEFQQHVPKGRKQDWEIVKLGKSIDEAFKTAQVARVRILDLATHSEKAVLYYIPVSPVLQDIAKRLGDYLHAQKKFRKPEDPWWNEMRELLESAANLLNEANQGELLGPPLLHTRSGHIHFTSIVPEGKTATDLSEVGQKSIIDVAYFDSYSDAREATS